MVLWYAQVGHSRILGLPHIVVWTPLMVFLWMIASPTNSLIVLLDIPAPTVQSPERMRFDHSRSSGAVQPSHVILFLVILPDAPPLNNPQLACNSRIGKPDGKGTDRVEQVTGRELAR